MSACSDLLLGSTAGMVFEVSLESTDRKEKAAKRVLDLGDVREPIKGLLQLPLPSHRLLVLVATPSRLYAFAGSTPLATLFADYPDPSGKLYDTIKLQLVCAKMPAESVSCD